MLPVEFQFNRIDYAFANFLAQRSHLNTSQIPMFKTLVARLSFEQNQGQSCILLSDDEQNLVRASALTLEIESMQELECAKILPLVLQNNYLYTHRYWIYKNRLASQWRSLLTQQYDSANLEAALGHYFSDKTTWQYQVAKQALTQAVAIIKGENDSDKATVLVKIVVLLQELSVQPLHIALAAATKEAAMRLQESIDTSIKTLSCSDKITQPLPMQINTLQRLLGQKPLSVYFYHDKNRPLPYDLVVINEASNVDLALMSKFFDALKTGARLILLSDNKQFIF